MRWALLILLAACSSPDATPRPEDPAEPRDEPDPLDLRADGPSAWASLGAYAPLPLLAPAEFAATFEHVDHQISEAQGRVLLDGQLVGLDLLGGADPLAAEQAPSLRGDLATLCRPDVLAALNASPFASLSLAIPAGGESTRKRSAVVATHVIAPVPPLWIRMVPREAAPVALTLIVMRCDEGWNTGVPSSCAGGTIVTGGWARCAGCGLGMSIALYGYDQLATLSACAITGIVRFGSMAGSGCQSSTPLRCSGCAMHPHTSSWYG